MKLLFIIAIIAGGAYVTAHFAPQNLKSEIFSTSIGKWVSQTLPRYLREKLSIPENPAAKRRELLDQLASSLSDVKRDLEKVVPTGSNLPSASAIQSGIAKVEEKLDATQSKLDELKSTNSGESVFRKFALRTVDAIFPAATTTAQCIASK